jgi:hypothetical protein
MEIHAVLHEEEQNQCILMGISGIKGLWLLLLLANSLAVGANLIHLISYTMPE